MRYQTTKDQCQASIGDVVCQGCGGKLEPIETVDNSGQPTYWVGCKHCSSFRSGVQEKYFKIARKLVEDGILEPYTHMRRCDYESNPEKLEYWLDSQTAGLSTTIAYIHKMLKEEEL